MAKYKYWITAVVGALGLLLGALLAVSFNWHTFYPAGSPGATHQENIEKFREAYNLINQTYLKPVDGTDMVEDAIQGMLTGLDPHTSYIPAKEMRETQEQLKGSFDGIGIEFSIVEDTIYVVAPLSGGPSQRLGIQAGDRIVNIDNKKVAGVGVTNNDVFKALRGPKGTRVVVQIRRRGVGELLTYEIVRDKIPYQSVDFSYLVNPETGYIKISRFGETTHEEFLEHLARLKAQGMKNLVLDLRDNPGGYFWASQRIADEFIGAGKTVVYAKGRIPEANTSYTATSQFASWEKGGLVVLVDDGSASASEIVSGAIQDYDRGLLVGTRTFGKGLVQSQQMLSDGSGLRITISRYYTPSGRTVQKPFENVTEDDYNLEVYRRYKTGEAYDPSKITFPDSLRFTTQGGRVVYGGGGIMPDVFIPNDTTGVTPYLYKLFSKRVFQLFSFKYAEQNPGLKEQYQNAERFASQFPVDEKLLRQVTQWAEAEGVPANDEEFKTSRRRIVTEVKAQLGHALYGNEAVFRVYLAEDVQFQRALKAIPAALELARSGQHGPEWNQLMSSLRSPR